LTGRSGNFEVRYKTATPSLLFLILRMPIQSGIRINIISRRKITTLKILGNLYLKKSINLLIIIVRELK